MLIDNDLKTAINFKIDREDEEGNFARFEIRFNFKDYLIDRIVIYNGYQKSDELFLKNARVKNLGLNFQKDKYDNMDFPENTFYTNLILGDIKEGQIIDFKNAIRFNNVSFIIESTYPGTKYEDIAISEIEFWYQGKKYEVANLKKVMEKHKEISIKANKNCFPQIPIIAFFDEASPFSETLKKIGIKDLEEYCYIEFRVSDKIIYYYLKGKLFKDNKQFSKIKNINYKNGIPIGEWYFNEFGLPFFKLKGMEWQNLNLSIYDSYEKFKGTYLEMNEWWFPYPQKEWPFQLDPSDGY
jgi:hypothetical protein